MYVYRGKLNWYEYAINEAFTIVFPTILQIDEPVCAYWQWTVDSSGDHKVSVEIAGVLNSVTRKANELRIGFFYENYYRFDAVVVQGRESLTVTMSNPAGDTASTTLDLIYSHEKSNESDLPQYKGSFPEGLGRCAIYTGKLNWYSYAVDEMLTLMVLPGHPEVDVVDVYALWQWTEDAKGHAKVNVLEKGPMDIQRPDSDSNELVIKFFSDHYYRFEGVLNEKEEIMVLRMSNPSGDRSPSIALKLQYPALTSKSRSKRGWFEGPISIVSNDTDEAVYCSIEESSSAATTKNITLAAIGEAFGVIGLFAAFPIVSTPAGVAVAITALTFSTLALYDTLSTPPASPSGLVFPGDNITRRSAVFSNNDLLIYRTLIDENGVLKLQLGLKKELGTNTWKLKEILDTTSFESILPPISLPEKRFHRIEHCYLIQVSDFAPTESGTEVSNLLEPTVGRDASGTMYTTNKVGVESMCYGIWEQDTKLQRDTNKIFWFLESVYKGATDRKVIHLPDSTQVILKLRNHRIRTPEGFDGKNLGHCTTESEALSIIKKEVGTGKYVAYSFYSGLREPLVGYPELPNGSSIEFTWSDNSYVWVEVRVSSEFVRIV